MDELKQRQDTIPTVATTVLELVMPRFEGMNERRSELLKKVVLDYLLRYEQLHKVAWGTQRRPQTQQKSKQRETASTNSQRNQLVEYRQNMGKQYNKQKQPNNNQSAGFPQQHQQQRSRKSNILHRKGPHGYGMA